ncbi:LOW QUALITY PROTEIN: hypothetical protein PHMEG_00013925 [Phytophthora megakarya]|uniref:Uncharacterized protein n=1 Tax=Phytophthora megakarya TaxID=4795 RepID=A0A225W535_9STRA|nr:LOW QUALITY PROTEIN: hypothetical protein PHMEG_00013925 [Phytophthora megakarya]
MILICARNDIDKLKLDQQKKIALKDMGRVHYLPGMGVKYQSLSNSLTAYIDKLVKKVQMTDAKFVGSPQLHNEKVLPIERNESKINDKKLESQASIGSLQYW